MSSARLDTPFGFLRRSFRILNEGEKRGLVWMFILIVANSFVDILGLAAVLPVIGVVLDPRPLTFRLGSPAARIPSTILNQ